MKSFLELIAEEEKTHKPVVMAFGRMNPPTTGHMKLIDKVHEIADKEHAHHVVVASHSQDAKKNPLSAKEKIKTLKRYSPKTNFVAASKEHPSLIQHAAKLNAAGHDHLIMVAGSDRVKEYHKLLHKYNGHAFNYKKIEVRSAGHRDPDAEGTEGMSGSKMREHAKNKDFSSFRQGVPSHVSDEHAKQLMHDTRKGMGLHEDVNRGKYKAIFVTGGPGSGKDVVIREGIAEQRAVEMNFSQVLNVLNAVHKRAFNSMDPKVEAVRSRGPLIINGPADDYENITQIKEELENLGYKTMMIFVHTTDEVSKERNMNLKRMVSESVRHDKWIKCNKNMKHFNEQFDTFHIFDNNGDMESLEESITDIYTENNKFLDKDLLEEKVSMFSEKLKKHAKENNSPVMQLTRKMGKIDDVRDGDVKSNSGYTFRTYTESNPTLTVSAQPRQTKFSMDNNKEKTMKSKGLKDAPTINARLRNTAGLGREFDTRQQGTVYPMSGLGDVTYRESIDDPGYSDMGVGGVLGGSSNKEPMQTLSNPLTSGIVFDKKKKKK